MLATTTDMPSLTALGSIDVPGVTTMAGPTGPCPLARLLESVEGLELVVLFELMPSETKSNHLSDLPVVTAGLRPELFNEQGWPKFHRPLIYSILAVLVLTGFAFRVYRLDAEGLSEDELNKLEAVNDYRAHGITNANGEHPMLMKLAMTASIVGAERWNAGHPGSRQVPVETALRLPNATVGALSIILLYLLGAELFGVEAALIAAALWAVDPGAIGFSRIAKEDTFVLFFFLLASFLWVRGQTVAETRPDKNPVPYYWATGGAFGALIASKYLPFLIAVPVSYNYVFQGLRTLWVVGKKRYFQFLVAAGIVFVICNPAILLPGTFTHMGNYFASKYVGHDGLEFMGRIYPHQWIDWLNGVPWYFYLVYLFVKLPLLTLVGFLGGALLLFRKRTGDGRLYLFFWAFYWVIAFVFVGGKFTRYLTVALPIVFLTAALAIQYFSRWLARNVYALFDDRGVRVYARILPIGLVLLWSGWVASGAAPFYRLYTNSIGGGVSQAGYYFPHDEFYDGAMRQSVAFIAARALPGARIASESPSVAEYYVSQFNRPDLICISSSDAAEMEKVKEGDFIIVARGRRYFTNDHLVRALENQLTPVTRMKLGQVPATDIFRIDEYSKQLVAAESDLLGQIEGNTR